MYIQPGQLKDIQKQFPSVLKEDCEVISEFGGDRGTYFSGSFLVKIKNKGVFKFQDGELIRQVK